MHSRHARLGRVITILRGQGKWPASRRLWLRGGADLAARDWRWSPSLMSVSSTSAQQSRSTRSSAWPQGTSGSHMPCRIRTGRSRCSVLDADQMVATFLDQMLGDGIGIAVERGLVIDAVALELGFHLGAHAVPHQPLGHVEGGRDQHETGQSRAQAGSHKLAREQERDPPAHRRADKDGAALANAVKHGGSLFQPVADRGVQQIALGQPMRPNSRSGASAGACPPPTRQAPRPWWMPCPTESPKAREWPGHRRLPRRQNDRRCGGACCPCQLPGIAVRLRPS